MGRKKIIPIDATQFTVHLSAENVALLEKIRAATGLDAQRMTPKSEVLRQSVDIGLQLLARELGVA